MMASSNIIAAEKSRKPPLTEKQLKRALSHIVIPKLDFREATLREAVDFLKKKSVELRSTAFPGPGYPLIVEDPQFGPSAPGDGDAANSGDPMPSTGERRVTVSLTNIPIFEALRYVVGLSNAKLSFRQDGIHIVDVGEPEPMFTHEFRIPVDFFPAFAREDQLGHTEHVAEMKKDFAAYLASNGLQLPAGASATLNSKAARLTVHTTEDQFGAIRKILATDRPASTFPVPSPKFPKVIEGPPREGVSDWRNAETDTARKLRTIRLRKLDLKDVDLYLAGIQLTKLSIQHDHESGGSKRGVMIRARGQTENPGWPPKISYTADDVSLFEAVKTIADLSDCVAQIDQHGVQWSPRYMEKPSSTRTYLVPPTTAAQLAKWPEFINQETPVPWMKDSGINLLSNGNANYFAKHHYFIVSATAKDQHVIEQANDKAWRDYYTSQKAKVQSAN
ncbi:hypothetical protein EV701_14316 [Chthoniobacter flavus]|nr:hypothetical protein EV701_14316 [Chthoniobacter flavus]